MANELKQRLREQIKRATNDVAYAIETRNLRLFDDARERRLRLQAQLDALAEAAKSGSVAAPSSFTR